MIIMFLDVVHLITVYTLRFKYVTNLLLPVVTGYIICHFQLNKVDLSTFIFVCLILFQGF